MLPRAGLGSPPWPRAPVPLHSAACSKCLLCITCACHLCRPGGILRLHVLVSGCFLVAARPSVGTLGITGLGGTVPTRAELGFPSTCTAGPTATRESDSPEGLNAAGIGERPSLQLLKPERPPGSPPAPSSRRSRMAASRQGPSGSPPDHAASAPETPLDAPAQEAALRVHLAG
ncbi:unnamed protein product [Rangifer tarandus platyrhynchus]|uniref:Uncharacterized protein n=1 Tax=Rangifer tarandus platyrhynchus TaxID=3082113 RepID=A0ABN8XT91_RANTA|nr:unnamed protein product [Rangifer tarandus platyrhynchus]